MRERVAPRYFLTFAPEALKRLAWAFADAPEAAIGRAEAALGAVRWHADADVAAWVVCEPFHAAVAVALLADEPASLAGARLHEALPELAALAEPREVTTYEHEAPAPGGRPTPLLDRVLRAVARADREAAPLSPSDRRLVTTVLLFCDVAKGGTPQQRACWRTRLGVDGSVHNRDSALILDEVLRRLFQGAADDEARASAEQARLLTATSGLVGMRLRGEVEREALEPLTFLCAFGRDASFARVWSVVNHCETQAVRAGLWTAELAAAFRDEEGAIWREAAEGAFSRTSLGERIARMRGGALRKRESAAVATQALERLGSASAEIRERLAPCQIWYAEAALGALSLDGAVRLLAYLSGAAMQAGIDTSRAWHLDLLGLVPALRHAGGEPRRYPVRLLETMLEATPPTELAQGRLRASAMVSFPATKGAEQALAVRFETSPEASALLTLLAIYERKATAAFHHTLKALCDLYGLRKDDYDRVHNEAAYLATMNAARSDKARMLDFAVPGTIVEVGPGGGVVLELCAERFRGTRVVGLDVSRAVVEALQQKTAGGDAGYEVLEGDAFELPRIFGVGEVTTVIFCSVLHEIFSYVPWGDPPARFRLEAVDAIVAAAYRALAPGGRIVVRDGVAPPDEPRVVEFLDPAWREGLDLFQKCYEPRRISFVELSPRRVRLGARDLYEFLTTFTWGPDSFPYEVREQRAVLPRDEYEARLVAACSAAEPERPARALVVPADLASYLQPGYPANILPHLRILDARAEVEVPMPDVNGVIVLEKPRS